MAIQDANIFGAEPEDIIDDRKYRVIHGNSPEELEKRVNEAINEGWNPVGTPFPMGKGFVVQAMVKAKDKIMRQSVSAA